MPSKGGKWTLEEVRLVDHILGRTSESCYSSFWFKEVEANLIHCPYQKSNLMSTQMDQNSPTRFGKRRVDF
jgi:hypothetical protein